MRTAVGVIIALFGALGALASVFRAAMLGGFTSSDLGQIVFGAALFAVGWLIQRKAIAPAAGEPDRHEKASTNGPAKASVEQLQECAGWLQAMVNPRTGQRLFVLHKKAPGSTELAPREFPTIDDVPGKAILFIAPNAKRILTDYPSLGRRVIFQDSGPDAPLFADGIMGSVLDMLQAAYAALAKSRRDAVAVIWCEDGLNFLGLLSAIRSAPASGAGDTALESTDRAAQLPASPPLPQERFGWLGRPNSKVPRKILVISYLIFGVTWILSGGAFVTLFNALASHFTLSSDNGVEGTLVFGLVGLAPIAVAILLANRYYVLAARKLLGRR